MGYYFWQNYIHFSEIYPKIKFVPCNELEDISNIDLFISNYSLSELTIETQLNYYNKIIKNSKIIYITYNLITNDSMNNYNILIFVVTITILDMNLSHIWCTFFTWHITFLYLIMVMMHFLLSIYFLLSAFNCS